MAPRRRYSLALALAAAASASCAPEAPAPAHPDQVRGAEPGDPLPGLTAEELARFEAGKAAFSRVFLAEEGLGPVYNENTCNACHSTPGIGGMGVEFDIHVAVQHEDGRCETPGAAGVLRIQVTRLAAGLGVTPETVPAGANQTGVFNAPPLWGRGLMEAIPEAALLALEDPTDADGDGIAGRVGRDAEGRVARFRRKADGTSLQAAAEGSVVVELGLSSPKHPRELVFSVAAIPDGADPTPEPEVDQATVDAMADFMRFLALPPRRLPADPGALAAVEAGEGAFHEVGCAACHTPVLTTGPNPVAALDSKLVPLYSDLLLHDMGPERATVCSPGGSATHVRTEPLMGLAFKKGYLYDGSAVDLWEAIARHGGEGRASADAFAALPELRRHALIAFLMTL